MATEASFKENQAQAPQAIANHSNSGERDALEGVEETTPKSTEPQGKKQECVAEKSSKQASSAWDNKNINSSKPRKRTKTGCLSELSKLAYFPLQLIEP